jgi:hypothetical protein
MGFPCCLEPGGLKYEHDEDHQKTKKFEALRNLVE